MDPRPGHGPLKAAGPRGGVNLADEILTPWREMDTESAFKFADALGRGVAWAVARL